MKIMRLDARALTLSAVLVAACLAPNAVSGQSQLNVAEARAFMGSWVLSFTSDMGAFSMNLQVTDMNGKVGATLTQAEMGMSQSITDITKSGESLVLAFAGDYQGQSFDAAISLEPAGEELTAWFDINDGAFGMAGTGAKAN